MFTDLIKLQLDLLAARSELAAGLAGSWLLHRVTPECDDSRPVLTLPGFLASDRSLLRLNRFLDARGFSARSWGLGRNLGPRDGSWGRQLDGLSLILGDTVRELADAHSAPVALVGQSLGGVYARELASQMPDEIDRVITLGSPTFHPYVNARHNRVLSQFGYWVSRQSHAEIAGRKGLLHWDADEPPLPCVAIHSPLDRIVEEANAVIPQYIVDSCDRSAPRENLGVLSSHIGMTVNPFVLLAIADRLVEDRNDWQHFDPYRYFPAHLHWAVATLYPSGGNDAELPALADSLAHSVTDSA